MERDKKESTSKALEKELKDLQESLKRCVECTNEADIILELAEDKFNIVETLNIYY